jgi:hypothetical protein
LIWRSRQRRSSDGQKYVAEYVFDLSKYLIDVHGARPTRSHTDDWCLPVAVLSACCEHRLAVVDLQESRTSAEPDSSGDAERHAGVGVKKSPDESGPCAPSLLIVRGSSSAGFSGSRCEVEASTIVSCHVTLVAGIVSAETLILQRNRR